jgi:predicted anti-sigma-YlaC factor YlaD
MTCKKAKALFSELYDRELNEETMAAVREHLRSCRECREDYKSFRKSLKVLKRFKILEPPRAHLEKVNRKVKKELF